MDIDLSFFRDLAAAAARETMPRFRLPGVVDNKLAGGFDPVTEADRQAELAIRTFICERFPDHGFVGEEFGAHNAGSRMQWVVDPVDGTRAFISGLPVWGTVVGLLEEGRAIAGMMAQPFTGELFVAAGEDAVHEWPGGSRPLRCRSNVPLSAATLFTTSPHLFAGSARSVLDRLEARVRLTRYGCDCYAFAMLAAGHVDLVIESGLQSYDIAGLIPLIERGGGVITQWDGGAAEKGGDILAAGSRQLWEEAMDVIGRRTG